MSLVGALVEHEGALRASLQAVYGLRLRPGGRTEPARTLSELTDLVAGLPPGCALWRAAGGAVALTDESMLLREAIYRLEVLDWHAHNPKGAQPKRIELPKPAHEARAEEAKQNAKAEAYARRQARRAAREADTG
ncbi:hypothetical protein [Microbacterium allomyrinae]|uniref:Uncharacterized protein n=1 Tax=Microbacterium allomyrinae TaxID=2830666 RepID=A0A9X1LU79_9MICO|nr:hypothetical protein [Microbacterium allomyrinae]MCC2031833.1 hypothetical protein [Microbacterium allomyrinae]